MAGCVSNPPLKHKKPKFSFAKTEVRSRSLCEVPCLPGSKIHPLWPSLAQNSVAKRSMPAHGSQKAVAMCSKALHNAFHAPVMVNPTRKHKKPRFSLGKTDVRSRSGCEVPCLHGSKIHPLCLLLAQNNEVKHSIPGTWRPKSCRYVL